LSASRVAEPWRPAWSSGPKSSCRLPLARPTSRSPRLCTSPVKRPVSGDGGSWIAGSQGLRKTLRVPDAPASLRRTRSMRACPGPDARQCHSLEYPHIGGGRRQRFHRGPHLAGARSQTASREDLQVEQRSSLRRKAGRCRQPLPALSGQRDHWQLTKNVRSRLWIAPSQACPGKRGVVGP